MMHKVAPEDGPAAPTGPAPDAWSGGVPALWIGALAWGERDADGTRPRLG